MIIDIHAHTSTHKMWNLHTEDASIERLQDEACRLEVKKIVVLATYFPFKGTGLCNRDMLERVKGDDLFIVFGSLDVMNNLVGGLKELDELAAADLIRGIKLYPGYQAFSPSDSEVFPVYEIANKYNLPVMFHGGELHHCCPSDDRNRGQYKCKQNPCPINIYQHLSHPDRLRQAVESFPNVKFIVSHLANPYFEALRKLMSEFGNVYTDISGQFVSGNSQENEDTLEYRTFLVKEINKFVEVPNGIERIMFGTDFPIQSYDDSVWLVEHLNLTPVEKANIYCFNAEKVLGQIISD
ncbi:hypothetical protein COT97_02965 [Candidatus Falkowbacteria bacterium CG10_big_fil_rev_8_21_14_0_10_39_11]|uniref:Amidohydrolase-related domain-containing protein n=1 Tax=Candidatus Falkowbacteria bacterium CG10_big_fil_rev_8_21_14_0_10_39_11 TaxID=1974565 RepID=A0A2H0V515_9BACT|nr:MAG: hypothetical protein COT97_02965 [Candidatus Falkowbacteria bacterium CG10_big_fil_rev_8_21_14_0_10_39_11]